MTRRPTVSRAHLRLGLLIFLCAVSLHSSPPQKQPPRQSSPPTSDFRPTLVFSQFSAGNPMHLVVYGDMRFADPNLTKGTNPRVRRWLAEQVGRVNPDALLLTGDMPFVGGRNADWQQFQEETASWRAHQILALPTIGNHETYGGGQKGIANYLENFPQIQGHRYYSALLGNVEVISLDSSSGSGPSTPQAAWFAGQLAHIPPQVQFLMILYHVPWVADRQSQMFVNLPSREALNLRSILEAHLPQIHARVLVFNGHIHNYERFERLKVEYIVSGGGGAEPYPLLFRGHSDLYRDSGFPVYHYLTLEVRGPKLHALMWKVKDPDADTLTVEQKDEFTLLAPSHPAPPRPSRTAAPTQ